VFAGRFDYGLDDKSRVSVPSKFREVLSTNYDMRLILTNLDGCIVAYPYQEWMEIQERISNRESLKKEARTFLRFYYSGVSECPIDRLGRILIPQALKAYANIQKNAVIIGMNRKIEIWAQETWEDLVRKATADREQMEDVLSDLGL
jgi:MraZ protein